MSMEAAVKLLPCERLGVLMSSGVSSPPVLCMALQLMGSIKDFVTSFTMGNLQLAFNCLESIICIHWLHGMLEDERLGHHEPSESIF
jgi:hypothetical protein